MGESNEIARRTAWFLAAHDGVITTDQALELGMTRAQVRSRVGKQLWVPHAQSTFLSAEHRMTDAARVRIAALAYKGAVVDRTSAAWLHGLLTELPDEVTLSVPRSVHPCSDLLIPTSARRRSFPAEDVTTVRGIATTDLPLTVLAAASELGEDGIALMDRALQCNLVTLSQLRAALERNSGAAGMRDARRFLKAADDLSESEFERRFVRFLRRNRITGWVQQFWIGNRRMDIVFPELGIVILLHGWAFHHHHDRWQTDLETASRLAASGWLPLPYSWKRFVFHEEEVRAEIVAAIESRSTVG